MRLAVSTLGCPGLPVAAAAALTAAQGYDGIELRSAPDGTVGVAGSVTDRRRWRRDLERVGVVAVSLSTYVRVCDLSGGAADTLERGVAELRLARDLGCSYARVFPGAERGGPASPETERRASDVLARLADTARRLGVGLALETHDSHPRAADVARLVDAPGCDDVGVVWDVLHPWRAGESVAATAATIGRRLAYLQVKDVSGPEDLTPLGLGEGAVPLTASLQAVAALKPDGWVSWEYERQWFPEAPALDRVGSAGRRWLEEAVRSLPGRG